MTTPRDPRSGKTVPYDGPPPKALKIGNKRPVYPTGKAVIDNVKRGVGGYAEDSGNNPKTNRPTWDEHAPDAKDPGRTNLVTSYAKQRRRAGTRGYT